MLSHLMRRNGLKDTLRTTITGFVAYYSSTGQIQGHFLDEQIQELNQDMESVFGPCGDNKRACPFTNSINTCARASSNLHEQSVSTSHSNERVPSSQGPLHSNTHGLNTHGLSHVDIQGKASMVNVSEKPSSKRVAVASGKVCLGPTAFALVSANQMSKGDVLTVAKIAGICGAKQTGNLIPLCHNISLSNIQVNLELDEQEHSVHINAEVVATGVTGVEMEALTAVSVAALTIYDMCKAVSKHVTISNIQLESKMGGKSGDWCRTKENV